MRRRKWAAGMLLGSLLGWSAMPTQAAEPVAETAENAKAPAVEATKYMRLKRDANEAPQALQTSIVRFTAPQGSTVVDLVSVVHVGDKKYYDELDERLSKYDVVLYEMVAPSDTKIAKGAKPGNHPVAALQNGLKDMLGLEHQLEFIDYSRDNMVHADMSPEAFSKSMKDRGESFIAMFFRMMGKAMAQQAKAPGKGNDVDLLAALLDNQRAGGLKRIMAEQFESFEGMMDAISGPNGSTIITERNKVALGKLSEQIAAGKAKIAIFYGAGHMSDFEKHLVDDFHLRRDCQEWLTAWNLEETPAAPPVEEPREVRQLRSLPWAPAALAAGIFAAF